MAEARLEIIGPGEDLLAWAHHWKVSEPAHHGLLAVPRLHLSYDTGLNFCAGQSYATVFAGAKAHFDDHAFDLFVIHSTFPMWTQARADLDLVCFVLLDGQHTFDPNRLGEAAREGRELLETLGV